jgi:hypothetical protein
VGQLELLLVALVAEAKQQAGRRSGDGRHPPLHAAEVEVEVRRDAERIGLAAVEAEEGLPLLGAPQLREGGPLQLHRRAGGEGRPGLGAHQPDGDAPPLLGAQNGRRDREGDPEDGCEELEAEAAHRGFHSIECLSHE